MAINAVALDISLTAAGVARVRIEDDGTVSAPSFRHFGEGGRANAPALETLQRIRHQAARLLQFAKQGVLEPDDVTVVMVEGVAFASQTAFAHIMGGLWWTSVHYLEREPGFHVAVANVASVKRYGSGNGGTKKDGMVAAAQRLYPALTITDHNDADALIMLGMLCRELGHPLEPSVQRVVPAALEKVEWPEFVRAYRAARP